MLTLSIDLSSAQGSTAIVRDGACLATRCWDATGRRSQALFEAMDGVLADAAIALPQVDRYAVGLGPGNYAGLRTSLAAVRGFAQPHNIPVWGVPSAAATARAATPGDATTIAVVGDARRERVWLGEYPVVADQQPVTFSLVPLADLPTRLSAGTLVVSADWDRLATPLSELPMPHVALLREPLPPPAAMLVALIESDGIAARLATDFLEPIYLHPPVFIEPRFTAATKRPLPPQA